MKGMVTVATNEQLLNWQETWKIQLKKVVAEQQNYLEAGGASEDKYYLELVEREQEYRDYLSDIEGQLNRSPGRPSLGVTKKVSLTLPQEAWDYFSHLVAVRGTNQSAVLRDLLTADVGYQFFLLDQEGREG